MRRSGSVICDSGGTYITFTGSNLDVARHPTLTVVVFVRRRVTGEKFTYNEIVAETVRRTLHSFIPPRLHRAEALSDDARLTSD